MPEQEFKIMILKKLSEMQENTDGQVNKMRRTNHNLNENATRS